METYAVGDVVWYDDAWGEVLDIREPAVARTSGSLDYYVWWQNDVKTWVWGSDLHSSAERRARGVDDRCYSCDHSVGIHDSSGMCWFTATSGRAGVNLVCQCSVNPEDLR